MATWPASIPQKPGQQGYSEKRQNAKLRTSMDSGPDKVRRRYTAVPVDLTCRFYMTTSQLSTFETFYVTTLLEGSINFDWTHPRTGAAISCRIKDVPEVSPAGAGWFVSLLIEVLP